MVIEKCICDKKVKKYCGKKYFSVKGECDGL